MDLKFRGLNTQTLSSNTWSRFLAVVLTVLLAYV